MFAAAIATDVGVRNALISLVHAYAAVGTNLSPLSAIYDPISGLALGGENR